MFGGASLLFPSLTGSNPFQGLPIAAVTPLLSAAAISFSVAGATCHPNLVATRPVLVGDLLLSLSAVTLASATALIASADPHSLAAARNTMGLIGLQLIASRLIGYRLQTVVPVLFVFGSAIFGRNNDGSVAAWAWPATTADALDYWVLPALLLLAGCTLSLKPIFLALPPAQNP
jgi:hypothetical protein